MHSNDREKVIAMTPLWKGKRLRKHINPNIPGYFEPTDEWNKEFSNDRIWS